jgi:foldase protein PrsA
MKRSLLSLVALLLVLAVAAGCGDAAGRGATVNGSDIPESTIVRELNAIRGNEQYVRAVEEQSQIQVMGQGSGGIDAAFAARVVTRQIIFKLITEEVEDRGIEISEEIRSQAEQDLVSQVGGEETWNAFPEDYRDDLVSWNAGALALQANILGIESLDDAALQQYYEDNPDRFEQACARHVLVETEEEAEAAREELLGGAEFATVAQERSLDTGSAQNGGELGCTFPGLYQPEFDEAVFSQPVGEVGEPVETVFGWHVIEVTSREQPDFDEVADEVRGQIQQLSQTEFTEWLQQALEEAEVTVNDRYGTWNDISSQVDPPNAPAPPATEPAVDPSLLPEG